MLRAIGLPIELTSSLSIDLDVSITNGIKTIQLTSADAAYRTIAAGTYRYNDMLVLLDDAIRRWLQSAISAAPNLANGALNVGTKNSKELTFSLAEVAGSNTAILTLELNDPSATIDGIPATFSAGNIPNTFGTQKWSHLMGLTFETDTAYAFDVAAGELSMEGQFQSHYIHIVDRSEMDSLPREKFHYFRPHRKDSGRVKNFKFGGSHFEREITFVDQDYQMGMAPLLFGRAYQIQASRDLIDFRSPYQSGAGSISVDKPYFDTRFFRDGSVIEIGGFRTRAFYNSGAYGTNTIKTARKIPTSVTIPTTGLNVKLVSDLWFIYKEAMALGCFFYYESDDYGDIAWIHESYVPNDGTEPVLYSERREAGVALYDLKWNLMEVEDDNLTMVNTTEV